MCERLHARSPVPLCHVIHVLLTVFLVRSGAGSIAYAPVGPSTHRDIRTATDRAPQSVPAIRQPEGVSPAVRSTRVLLCPTSSSLAYQRSPLGEARRICGLVPALTDETSPPAKLATHFSCHRDCWRAADRYAYIGKRRVEGKLWRQPQQQ
jgi:hypothetical protein